ncbi:MAG: transposase [Candidatus Omnitrophica bacterium]|nr:transposase [Candidatus Omnitrophota bacterium]
MPDGPRLLIEGACYHLMVRGNNKQRVFTNNEDLNRYLGMLKKYKRKYKFKMYGYCLMPNHVHIIGLAEEPKNLAKFMHGLNRAYAGYFNKTYNRVGHLWQGRFKSMVIVQDKYLIDCINYVELNPIRANIVKSPCAYLWSSYRERNMLEISVGLLDEISL